MHHTCSQDGCSQVVVERCFDCGAYLCAAHTAAIQVPTYSGVLREVVCSTCLLNYLAAPGPFGAALLEGDLNLDPAAPITAGPATDNLQPGIPGVVPGGA
jgi:hypothetical protein